MRALLPATLTGSALVLVSGILGGGCGPSDAKQARAKVRETHIPRVMDVIREDFQRHREAVREAANRLKRGFAVGDRAKLTPQMRSALKAVRRPPKGIATFFSSPMSFLAAIDADGRVIARDAEPDRMAGKDFGARYEVVRNALKRGRAGYQLGEFPAVEKGGQSSFSMLFVAPVRDGARVTSDRKTPATENAQATRQAVAAGAVVAGIPLWRMAQRLSRQLRAENVDAIGKGLVLWVYLYKGARVFHFDTPPELDAVVPNAATRRKGLAKSPHGFTGQIQLFGRWYGYGVTPAPRIGKDVGVIVFRADP